ncbi:MAG: DUF4396 domain-containing protein [Bacteroidales bacterium]
MWNILAWITICLAILSAIYLGIQGYRRPAKMKIMNVVWVLTGLWASILGVWAYFRLNESPMVMEKPAEKEKMNMGASMSGMNMTSDKPLWERVALSSLHCGAGCVLADLIGETLGFYLFRQITGWSIVWQWILDYFFALMIGAFFQYAVIHKMVHLSKPAAFWKALKIDFLSLTGWQTGMYGFMYIVFFVSPGIVFTANEMIFWWIMQLAMLSGFIIAYPINWVLIKSGYKPSM